MLSQNRTQLLNERRSSSFFSRFPSMDFASAFNDEEVGETRTRNANTPSTSTTILIRTSTTPQETAHDYPPQNYFDSLMLDTSVHTNELLNYDSVEHQLSALERDSDNLFDSLLGKRKQNTSSSPSSSLVVPLKESTGFPSSTRLLRRNSVSFNFNEDLGCNDIDDLFISRHDHQVVKGLTTSPSEFTNNDFSSSIFVSTESSGPRDSKNNNKPPSAEAMHAFNQEYESRLNDLRQCMSRTKSSRSRVAKLKQTMKQRCFSKYSYRNNLAKSVGINTTFCTDYSR